MNRIYVGLILAMLTLVGMGLAFDNRGGVPYAVVKRFHDNTYVVTNNVVRDERVGIGSGVWIDERHLLTNCHVVKMFRELERDQAGYLVEFYNTVTLVSHDEQKVFKGEVLACDVGKDLALIRSHWPNHDIQPIDLEWRTPRFGAVIYSAGYHHNLPLSPKVGLMGKHGMVKGKNRVGVSMSLGPGDSGSPIFDRWGNLVALVTAIMAAHTSYGHVIQMAEIGVAIPGITINTFLDEAGYNE